jgi:hypothetical protein
MTASILGNLPSSAVICCWIIAESQLVTGHSLSPVRSLILGYS